MVSPEPVLSYLKYSNRLEIPSGMGKGVYEPPLELGLEFRNLCHLPAMPPVVLVYESRLCM